MKHLKINTKRKKWIFVFIFIFIIIVILFKIFFQNETDIILEIQKFKYEKYTNDYESINRIKLIELTATNSSSVIFIGGSNCPDCIKQITNINNILKYYNSENHDVYYYNTNKHNKEEDLEMLDKLGVNYIPMIMIIENKNITLMDYDDIIEF